MRELVTIRNSFKDVVFDEEPHIYRMGRKELTSCTTVLKHFMKPYNSNYWSGVKAKQYGVSKAEIFEMWASTATYGKTRGTHLHNYLELKAENKKYSLPHYNEVKQDLTLIQYDSLVKEFKVLTKQADAFLDAYSDKLTTVCSELVIGDKKLGVGGMIDNLSWDNELNGFCIYDWKTDKKLEAFSEYNNKFLDPIKHLDDCELNKYSLQVHIYEHIFTKVTGIPILEKKVVWFNMHNDSYKIIELPNLKKEAETILRAFSEAKELEYLAKNLIEEQLLF